MKQLAPLVVLLALAGCGGSTAEDASTVPHFQPKTEPLRTVIVGATATPDAGGPIRAALVAGTAPGEPTRAEVLTDTDCAPDFAGISHCRNELRLADGRTITVRHDHDMQRYSCLSPGEHVRVVPA